MNRTELDQSHPKAGAPVSSNEPGAWTCQYYGFRGFWNGAMHRDPDNEPDKLPDTYYSGEGGYDWT